MMVSNTVAKLGMLDWMVSKDEERRVDTPAELERWTCPECPQPSVHCDVYSVCCVLYELCTGKLSTVLYCVLYELCTVKSVSQLNFVIN